MDDGDNRGEDNPAFSGKGEEGSVETTPHTDDENQKVDKGNGEDSRSGDEKKQEVVLNLGSGSDNPAFSGDNNDKALSKDNNEEEGRKTVLEDVFLETWISDDEHKADQPSQNFVEEKADEETSNRPNQNIDEDYCSNESGSTKDAAEAEESDSKLKRWGGELELDQSEANGIEQEKKAISNGKPHSVKKSRPSPFRSAFFLSKYITFWWMQSLFSTGYKKALEQEDLYDACPNDSSNELCDKLEREWNRQAYDENGKIREDASLVKAIVRVFGFKYMLLAIPSILAACPVALSAIFAWHLTTSSFANRYGFDCCMAAPATSRMSFRLELRNLTDERKIISSHINVLFNLFFWPYELAPLDVCSNLICSNWFSTNWDGRSWITAGNYIFCYSTGVSSTKGLLIPPWTVEPVLLP